MDAILASLVAFGSIFGSALAGVQLARRLPEPHLSTETRTAVSVSMAVVGTMAALVLGLMINTSSTSFNSRSEAVESLAVGVLKLNRALIRYGSDASSIRETLQNYTKAKIDELSNSTQRTDVGLPTLQVLETINDQILALEPSDDRQRNIQGRARELAYSMADARWILVSKSVSAVPFAFLTLLILWLSLLFASFGLFAPRNATVIVVLFLCAFAISGGIFMILELGSPARGLIRPSVAPMYTALSEIRKTMD